MLNLNDSNSWLLRNTVLKTASTIGDDRAIDPFLLGKGLYSSYLAVGVSVGNSKDTWRHGGYIAQAFNFPATSYSQVGQGLARSQDLLIDSVSIVKLPIVTNVAYSLYYFPLKYFERVRVQVWEYTGETGDIDTSKTSLRKEDVNLITESIATEFGDRQIDIQELTETSKQDKLEIITQLNQIDAGIYTLAEGLAELLPIEKGQQLQQNTRTRLNLDMGFI